MSYENGHICDTADAKKSKILINQKKQLNKTTITIIFKQLIDLLIVIIHNHL